eukprot:TRINITY_DN21202_c0_g1_i1.p1 TRINITY_DN21202_c0_g1~~TRINITY_DN21202_c0_g1_i1.p1  ORF type:complete len:618 (+),score=87.75 TRINITY_DN21202_c0_g1_i1:58-1911(+)
MCRTDLAPGRQMANVVHLGRGVVWHCCELDDDGRSAAGAAQDLAPAVQVSESSKPSLTDLVESFANPLDGLDAISTAGPRPVATLVPEASKELRCCRWDGDGHYDMSRYADIGLPTLGQIIAHVRMVDKLTQQACMIVHLSSEKRRGCGAILAGAVLVLSEGFSADAAYAKIAKACPSTSANDKQRWDRFPGPFASNPATFASSVTVYDCLAGLQFARDHDWMGPRGYRGFDIAAWEMLRRKYDATWLIPGEVLAMAHPTITVKNPKFDELVLPGKRERTASRDSSDFDAPVCPSEAVIPQESPGNPLSASMTCKLFRGRGESSVSTSTPSTVASSPSPLPTPPSQASLYDMRSRNDSPNSLTSVQSPMSSNANSSASLASQAMTVDCIDDWDFYGDELEDLSNDQGELQLIGLDKQSANELELPPSQYNASEPCPNMQKTASRSTRADDFCNYLSSHGIKDIVRLNHAFECPDQIGFIQDFESHGFRVANMAFDDGDVPTKAVVKTFLTTCSKARKERSLCMAVHCMGGLGRTSVTIGTYAVAHHKISGSAWHGWARLCRPGCVQTRRQEVFLRNLGSSSRATAGLKKVSSTVISAMKRVTSFGNASVASKHSLSL